MPLYVNDLITVGEGLRHRLDELYDIRDRHGDKEELERNCDMFPSLVNHNGFHCPAYGFLAEPFENRCFIIQNLNDKDEYIDEYTIFFVDKDALIKDSIREFSNNHQEIAQMIFDFLADNNKPIQD